MKRWTIYIFLIIVMLFVVSLAVSDDSCRKKLPTSIIIGVKKSGTYALLRYLNLNRFIRGALKLNGVRLNEIHYFDKDANYNRGVSWYESQMPMVCGPNETIVIEKTPGYFRNGQAPRRVYDYNSNVKLILIVRDPVRRLESELTHCDLRQKSLGLDRKCYNISDYFERMFRENASESDWLANRFIRNSVYYLDLLKWLEFFKLNRQLIVVDGENFIKTPWIELNRVERFLGINGSFISRKNFYFDKSKNFYCLRDVMGTGGGVNGSTGASSRCLGKNKGRKKHIFLSEYVRKQLRGIFVKWNNLLFDLIGKRFDW